MGDENMARFNITYHKHEEEGNCPNRSTRKLQHNFRISDKHQTGTGIDHLFNFHSLKRKRIKILLFLEISICSNLVSVVKYVDKCIRGIW